MYVLAMFYGTIFEKRGVQMRIIVSGNTSGTFNLVLEKYLVDNFMEDTFIIWSNSHGVYIGKNQNTLEELNMDFVNENNFEVFRRLSGGGTIFHDMNTVYYSFITKNERTVKDNFIHWNNVIVEFLNSVNVKAELSGRNDVLIEGRKISGSAEHYSSDLLVHHGSLLFDTDIAFLAKSLTPNKKKFLSKAVNSVKARVDNIANHTSLSVEEFKNELVKFVEKKYKGVHAPITELEIEETNKMIEDFYGTYEWNFGKSPKYTHFKEDKYPYGIVGVKLEVKEGLIKNINILGDFFSKADISELEKMFIGCKHELSSINKIVSNTEISKYIVGAIDEDLVKLIW